MHIKTLVFILLIFFVHGCATQKIQKKSSYTLLDHGAFKVYYDPDLRLARYVVYELSAENLKQKVAKRKNKFKVDPLLVKMNLPFVKPTEYKKTGYDQGHLAPSGDFTWDQSVNDQTFVMSNMAPQSPGLNRDAWRRLEEKVRRWGCGEKKITVVTGPVFTHSTQKLRDGLIVPEHFFKIIFDETPPKKVIAFLYSQNDTGDLLNKRQVHVAEIENQLSFKLASVVPENAGLLERAPASISDWKEADCKKK